MLRRSLNLNRRFAVNEVEISSFRGPFLQLNENNLKFSEYQTVKFNEAS